MYDVIIIGGGPAGLTAAIYSARYQLKTLIISKADIGSAEAAHKIENFPGEISISGYDLVDKFRKHAKYFGVEIKQEEVAKLERKDDNYIVGTKNGMYEGKAVILAYGLKRRKLNLKNEDEFLGHGVTHCTTCDGPLFHNKKTVVVGGGDSGTQAAMLLVNNDNDVTMLVRSKLIGEPIWVERVKNNSKIKVIEDVTVEEIIGDGKLEKLKLSNGEVIDADGLFIEIGAVPITLLAENLGVKMDESGYIVTDSEYKTSMPGVFAAGDITIQSKKWKQIVVACGQAALAAYSAFKYLSTK